MQKKEPELKSAAEVAAEKPWEGGDVPEPEMSAEEKAALPPAEPIPVRADPGAEPAKGEDNVISIDKNAPTPTGAREGQEVVCAIQIMRYKNGMTGWGTIPKGGQIEREVSCPTEVIGMVYEVLAYLQMDGAVRGGAPTIASLVSQEVTKALLNFNKARQDGIVR